MAFFRNSTNEELTHRLADEFCSLKVGETIEHETIQAIVARAKPTVRGGIIQAARRRANETSGALIHPVRGVGYTRLPDGEAHAVGTSGLVSIRRKAQRLTKTIVNTVTKSNAITDQEVIRSAAVLNTLGLIGRQTYRRNVTAKETEIISEHNGSSPDAARTSLEKMRAMKNRR